MSLLDEVADWCARGRLFVLEPYVSGQLIRRTIVLSAELHLLIYEPWDGPSWEYRCRSLWAYLDAFILGVSVTVAKRPFLAKKAYFAQLHPASEEVWEIRSRNPRPSLRIFGRFAATDVFVALTWSKRAVLGAAKSREWRDARERCKSEWRRLFPAFEPHSGESLGDHISTGAVLV